MKISNYIKDLRSKLNLTQKQLGERIEKNRCAIANYETGRAIPPGDVLLRIQELELLYPSAENPNQQTKDNPSSESVNR